jgi:phosphatidylserine/phosphatidylglycerophosphate/cardiolipin synthase-like enzyme
VLALGSLLALSLVFVSLLRCLADPAPVIHYAPVENLEQADVALFDRAEHDIDIAAYVLTDWPVMRALIRAAGRGVRVRIYMDGRRIGEREPTPLFRELLANPAIETRFKRPGSPLMHLKSYQIDGRWLRTGAANFSASGLKRQDNDLLVIDSQAASRKEKPFLLPRRSKTRNRGEPGSASLENPEGHRYAQAGAPARSENGQSSNVLRRPNFVVSSEPLPGHQ